MEGRQSEGSELLQFFVMQQQMAAMMYMGKMVRPDTGQAERNLEAAKFAIDLLGMFEEKTKGNLTPEEDQLLTHVLTNLRLNYLDEAGRSPTPEVAQATEAPPPAETKASDGS